jgi:hypothetical protein
MTAHDFLEACAGIAIILFLFSYLYWSKEIGREVNETLPTSERTSWSLTERIPLKMHSLWSRHEQLFPKSRKANLRCGFSDSYVSDRHYHSYSISLGYRPTVIWRKEQNR